MISEQSEKYADEDPAGTEFFRGLLGAIVLSALVWAVLASVLVD